MFGVENMLMRVANEIVMANLHYLFLGVLLRSVPLVPELVDLLVPVSQCLL